jgi:hypothetical protein
MSHEVAKVRAELRQRTLPQLEVALERQKKILRNKLMIQRLPDKGEKSRLSVLAIEQLIEERIQENDLTVEMERLKINTDKMEWKNRLLDSDDDSDPEGNGRDPLAVLAQGVVPAPSARARPGPEENPSEASEMERFAVGQCARVDEAPAAKERFTPHSAVRQAALDPGLRERLGGGAEVAGRVEVVGRAGDQEGRSPSIPMPPAYACSAKQLSLGASLQLQQEQERRVRRLQTAQAEVRLAAARAAPPEPAVELARFLEHRGADEASDEEEDSGDEGLGVVGVTGPAQED